MNRIVIFGASGFIGTHLTKKLAKTSKEIVVLIRRDIHESSFLQKFEKRLEIIRGDFNNEAALKNILKKDDIVFDLTTSSVPYTSLKNPLDEINTHLFSQVQFIQIANKIGVKKIIFTSSGGGVYGPDHDKPISEVAPLQPVSPHAISKVAIEYYLHFFHKIYQIPYLVYRISNPYGLGQMAKTGFGLIPTLFNHVKENKRPILYDHGNLIRDFIYIDDLIEAMAISYEQKNIHNIYNVGSGEGVCIKDVWKIVKDLTKTNLEPIYENRRAVDARALILNISRFTNEYKWKPLVPIFNGLKYFYQLENE